MKRMFQKNIYVLQLQNSFKLKKIYKKEFSRQNFRKTLFVSEPNSANQVFAIEVCDWAMFEIYILYFIYRAVFIYSLCILSTKSNLMCFFSLKSISNYGCCCRYDFCENAVSFKWGLGLIPSRFCIHCILRNYDEPWVKLTERLAQLKF